MISYKQTDGFRSGQVTLGFWGNARARDVFLSNEPSGHRLASTPPVCRVSFCSDNAISRVTSIRSLSYQFTNHTHTPLAFSETKLYSCTTILSRKFAREKQQGGP